MMESHQVNEVHAETAAFLEVARQVRSEMKRSCCARPAADGTLPVDSEFSKMVYLIRHGEGLHNVAQREWRAAGKPGEPYTVANDPSRALQDPVLTETGRQQALALGPRLAAIQHTIDLVLVSPMRRATETALLALPGASAVACELLHETGGRHTCDKRLDKDELAELYGDRVDYSGLATNADPYWDETVRESKLSLARRAAALVDWLGDRSERVVVVAAHSGFLLSLLKAVLIVDDPQASRWFATGECRAFLFTWSPPGPVEGADRPAA